MNKYNAKKTVTTDGEVFDSQKEALRWSYLRLMERAGLITDLQRQVPFELIPAQYETYERYGKKGQRLKDGRRLVEKAVVYVADFAYKNEQGEMVVEDVKGYRNPRTATYGKFVIKRKLMRLKGIKILET